MLKTKEGTCFLGRTLDIEFGNICLSVTLDVGPRIISLNRKNESNIMFQDVDDLINKDISHIYGKNKVWHLYGGHRIWASPESEYTYYPDNNPVNYEVLDNTIVFKPEPWNVVDLRTKLILEFVDKDTFNIRMGISNIGKTEKRLSLWGLTVLRPGGCVSVDLSTKDTGYLANRNLVIWSYTDLADSRLKHTNDKLVVYGKTDTNKAFKIGTHVENLVAKYTIDNTIFIKEVDYKEGEYPDMHCNYETYTNGLMHEVETLSPLYTLKPSEEIIHTEKWSLLAI